MRKLKSILSFLLSLILTVQVANFTFVYAANDYDNHWAKPQITRLLNENIVTGYSDGSIKPENNISRAEFVTLTNKLFGYNQKANINFTDVSSNLWYADQFLIAKEAGYLTGDNNGNANPENAITRAEICVIVSKVLNLETVNNTSFTDNSSIPSWAKGYIGALANAKLINGYPDGSFGAGKNITRAEAFVIVNNILDIDNSTSEPTTALNGGKSNSENNTETTTESSTETTTKKTTSSGSGGGGGGSSSSSNTTTTTEAATETTTEAATETTTAEITETTTETITSSNIVLSASESSIFIGDSKDVIFTAKVSPNLIDYDTEVILLDLNGNYVAELLDNGLLDDDIANDNVYTASIAISFNATGKYYYHIGIGSEQSNQIAINCYDDNSEVIYKNYSTLTESLTLIEDTIKNIEENYSEVCDELFDAVESYIKEEIEAGIVDSYERYEGGIEIYITGGLCYIYYPTMEFSDVLGSERVRDEVVSGDSLELAECIEFVQSINLLDNSDYATKYITTLQPYLNSLPTSPVDSVASSITGEISYYNFNKNYDESAVSIENLKNLSNESVIILNGHGGWSPNRHSFFGTGVTFTEAILQQYYDDFISNRLITLTSGRVGVTGAFFDYYYNSSDLSDAIIFLGCCDSMGKNDVEDYYLSNVFLSKGAAVVAGFLNSIHSDYDAECVKALFNNLLIKDENEEYYNIDQSYSNTINSVGSNDSTAINGYYGKFLINASNHDFRLDDIQTVNDNLSFENGLSKWITSGDCRAISQLGTLYPTSGSYMAIVGTGLGAVDDSDSSLKGYIKLDEDAESLTFDYNFVSEEPMEWVGSKYDDELSISITCDGTTEIIRSESVNTSEWIELGENYFNGGDSTTYHTGWATPIIDIEKYAGKTILIEFNVWDEGDSIYDSAAIIDNIKIYDGPVVVVIG